MEKAEIVISNYYQEEKDQALVAALKSQNSVLIELALKLKPNLAVGGGALLNYAVANADMALLGELLCMPEIVNNQEIMNEAVRLAVLSERMEWFDVLKKLLEEFGNIDVALATLLENTTHKINVIMWLVENGASAYIQPMHLERILSVREHTHLLFLVKSMIRPKEFSAVLTLKYHNASQMCVLRYEILTLIPLPYSLLLFL